MELKSSHKQKQDIYERPRLLTSSELELLKLDMRASANLLRGMKLVKKPLNKRKVSLNKI